MRAPKSMPGAIPESITATPTAGAEYEVRVVRDGSRASSVEKRFF
jgi:hypothetical protein